MRQLVLSGTTLRVSRLSFGTASIHHLASSRRRQDLLAAAYDRGFTHFDTAPYYGFGIAEEQLGRFIAARPNSVTVTTKVGLYPPPGARASTVSVWVRKAAGRVLPRLNRPLSDWSLDMARTSLESSLRRLRRDHVDFLLLHEPRAGTVDSHRFLEWLQRERERGRIRAYGLAGPYEAMQSWIDQPLAQVLQIRDSVSGKEADPLARAGRPLQFTYGYLAAQTRAGSGVSVGETLRAALARNATGSILVSTRQAEHLDSLAAAAASEDGNNN